jgi:ABC-type phosphate transport system substrate-binding protein
MHNRKSGLPRHGRLALLIFMLVLSPVPAAAQGPILIVHPDNPAAALPVREVRAIFLGEMSRWPNQERIAFVTLKGEAVHEKLMTEYVGKTPSQYDIFWKKKVFSGQGRMPKSMDSPEAVVEFVARTPGGIGYVPAGTPAAGVKEIPVR